MSKENSEILVKEFLHEIHRIARRANEIGITRITIEVEPDETGDYVACVSTWEKPQ